MIHYVLDHKDLYAAYCDPKTFLLHHLKSPENSGNKGGRTQVSLIV